jgi:hypothetical protein
MACGEMALATIVKVVGDGCSAHMAITAMTVCVLPWRYASTTFKHMMCVLAPGHSGPVIVLPNARMDQCRLKPPGAPASDV